MELRHIRSFIAVAEDLHFGRAAARLHISQPPLTVGIRQLEQELGVQLLIRTTRSVQLTDAGRAFLPAARKVMEELDLAVLGAKAAGNGPVGRVRIGFTPGYSREALPRIAMAVRAAYPGVVLELHGQLNAQEAMSGVADGTLDIGFVNSRLILPGIQTRVIAYEGLICALPNNHPLAFGSSIAVEDLKDQPFVAAPANRGSSARDELIEACGAAGFHPRIVQEAGDLYTIMALVAAGVGITLTLSSGSAISQPGVTCLPLRNGKRDIDVSIGWRIDASSLAVKAVVDLIDEILSIPPRPDPQS